MLKQVELLSSFTFTESYQFISFTSDAESKDQETVAGDDLSSKGTSPRSRNLMEKPQLWAVLDGIRLILSSTYLLFVSLFLWLSAVVSSFFYFQVRIAHYCLSKK